MDNVYLDVADAGVDEPLEELLDLSDELDVADELESDELGFSDELADEESALLLELLVSDFLAGLPDSRLSLR